MLSAQHYQFILSFIFQIVFPLTLIIISESVFLAAACAHALSLRLKILGRKDFGFWCSVLHLSFVWVQI